MCFWNNEEENFFIDLRILIYMSKTSLLTEVRPASWQIYHIKGRSSLDLCVWAYWSETALICHTASRRWWDENE